MNFNGTLPNGVELYTCLDPTLPEFCLMLLVRRGPLHEPRDKHGLAHFLEHAVFRSISERMDRQLYPTLTRLGVDFDATTYETHVLYTVTGPAAQAEFGLDLLLMILDPLRLSLDALNLERRRVQAEIRESDDSADAFAHNRVWRGTPIARSIVGTAASVNRIGLESLAAEHARWFTAGGFCFCAAGSISLDLLRARLEALDRPQGEPSSQASPVPADFFRRGAAVAVDDASYTWLRFCVDLDISRHPPLALTLLTQALRSEFGLFYRTLSEDTALAYGINHYFVRCANIGSFTFDFETPPERLGEAVDVVVDMLRRLRNAPDGFWHDVIAGYIALERCQECDAQAMCEAWLFDNARWRCGFSDPDARIAAYAAITPDALRALAAQVFVPDNLLLCVRGNKRRIDPAELHERLMRLADPA